MDWAAGAAVLLGGLMLLNRQTAPQTEPPATVDSDDTGRGHPAAPPSAHAQAAGHETLDLDARSLAVLVLVLGTTVALVIGGIVLLLGVLRHADRTAQPSFTAQETTQIAPPAPTLQADPVPELARLRAAEDKRLHSYGWADAAHTRAQIPIDRAMTLMVGRGLGPPP
jgi:hypothetical protein